jgi:hypothetical protein
MHHVLEQILQEKQNKVARLKKVMPVEGIAFVGDFIRSLGFTKK